MTSVSVIMAVCNGERFLDEAIKSVLSQTHGDFEFVIVDDGSSDSTASILREFSRLDSRLLIHRQDNTGPASARNRALSIARHSVVAIMDADDRMLPHRLERQLEFLAENPGASVVCSYSYLIDAAGRRIGRSQIGVDVDAGIRDREPSNFLEIVHPSVMMSKEDIVMVGGYNGGLSQLEDRELWGRLVTSGKQIKCQPECLMEYRLHGGSLTMWNVFKPAFEGRTINMNVIRRLEGKHELSIKEVEILLAQRPLLRKLNQERKFLSTKFYKNATRMYAERNLGQFTLLFGFAMLLMPIVSLRRVWQKGHKYRLM